LGRGAHCGTATTRATYDRALRAAAQFEFDLGVALDDRARLRQVADGLIRKYPGFARGSGRTLVLARASVDSANPPNAMRPWTPVMSNQRMAELKPYREVRLGADLTAMGKKATRFKTACGTTLGSICAAKRMRSGRCLLREARTSQDAVMKELPGGLGAGQAGSAITALQMKLERSERPPCGGLHQRRFMNTPNPMRFLIPGLAALLPFFADALAKAKDVEPPAALLS